MRPRHQRVTEPDDQGATAVLRRVAPGWGWLRDNFKLPALLTIAGLVAAGVVGYLQVINRPDLAPRITALEASIASIQQSQAAAKQEAEDFNRRVAAQEDEWKIVHQAAAQRVPRGRPAR